MAAKIISGFAVGWGYLAATVPVTLMRLTEMFLLLLLLDQVSGITLESMGSKLCLKTMCSRTASKFSIFLIILGIPGAYGYVSNNWVGLTAGVGLCVYVETLSLLRHLVKLQDYSDSLPPIVVPLLTKFAHYFEFGAEQAANALAPGEKKDDGNTESKH